MFIISLYSLRSLDFGSNANANERVNCNLQSTPNKCILQAAVNFERAFEVLIFLARRPNDNVLERQRIVII